ncbi:hypothetical protein RFI_21128 [Reticulomyxa filosa]|uniref:RING-type domain-containing protein n=1 Tax=Reticulomyxa filosa TaxID=46433 RepID=X6MSZ3_RETFI|nr:hypothetical protein RFI_21128 [Reticulomyxa filosa]|eukprot:ETO16230.1 hypothetical protein RFI_21128 [Reticulomyxa filosa]
MFICRIITFFCAKQKRSVLTGVAKRGKEKKRLEPNKENFCLDKIYFVIQMALINQSLNGEDNNVAIVITTSPQTKEHSPSMSRRLSQQFDQWAAHPPGGSRVVSSISQVMPLILGEGAQVHESYYCHVCFAHHAKKNGMQLMNCGHIFCKECIKGYWTSRIENGNVYLKCFHPTPENV